MHSICDNKNKDEIFLIHLPIVLKAVRTIIENGQFTIHREVQYVSIVLSTRVVAIRNFR